MNVLVRAEARPAGLKAQQAQKPAVGADDNDLAYVFTTSPKRARPGARPASCSRAGPLRPDSYRTNRRSCPGHPTCPAGHGAGRAGPLLNRDGQQRSATQTRPRPWPTPTTWPRCTRSGPPRPPRPATSGAGPADEHPADRRPPTADRREPSHRCLRRSGAPGTVGGRRCCRALPLTRLAACPGASCGRASPTACPDRSAYKGNFLCSQPRALSCREGCRERRLWALPRPSRPAGRSSFSYRPARLAPM